MAQRGYQRADLALMHRAARMYYLEELNQAGIAERLNVSRPTVSRMLSEARRIGLVRIKVHDPSEIVADDELTALASALGIERVWLAPFGGDTIGSTLAGPAAAALRATGLVAGDVLLVSSGRTIYELGQTALPTAPGVDIVPTVGGMAEPEAWYQTNELARAFAERMRGRPHFLFAEAMPSVAMRATLLDEPAYQRVTAMWDRAKVAMVGIGAPPTSRNSIPPVIPLDNRAVGTAVGDVSLNLFDADGGEIVFPGSDRMVRISPQQLRRIPCTIAVAMGADKTASILGAARAGLIDWLVTDIPTAELLLEVVAAQPVRFRPAAT